MCQDSCDVADVIGYNEDCDSSDNEDYRPNYSLISLQSNDVMNANVDAAISEENQENVQFGKAVDSDKLEIPQTLSQMQVDMSSSVNLGDFLTRPVLIHTYNWILNDVFDQSFSPWYDYFDNPAVKSKLDNYYLLRCNLNLKFLINASPFYYSCLMVSYRPLANNATFDYYEPCAVNGGFGLEAQTLMGRSQRPKCFLYPQDSQGATMKLPFFYPLNWLDITSTDSLLNMGTINMNDLFFPLSSANGILGSDVTIQVYAWATEVDLGGPTVSLSLQSADEYGKGCVSKPASAIARYTGMLGGVPFIGPFATATSMAATAVSDIAALFGYTNVPVIADPHAFIPKNNPNYAATDIGIPVEKLTLDSKNEISIDPKVCGVDLGDELAIKNIVTRETFLETIEWPGTYAVNDLLWNSRITPSLVNFSSVSGVDYVQGTPMWMVGSLFKYWRGDIIFKFKFLCTKFHRGRVKISWDPAGDIANTAESTNLVYTKIVDISEETEVEFSIPYTQPASYLNTGNDIVTRYGSVPLTSIASDPEHNGIVTVRVLTVQTSPVSDAPIGIAMFVRGHENLEFADPLKTSNVSRLSPYVLQSEDIFGKSTTTSDVGMAESSTSKFINLIHMGETINSLRTLLRRTYLHRTFQVFDGTLAGFQTYTTAFQRMPLYFGYDTNGYDQAAKTVPDASGVPFNYVHSTPINWITSCFVGNRGSIIWHADVNSSAGNNVATVTLSRNDTLTNSSNRNVENVISFTNTSALPDITRRYLKGSEGGIVVADNRTQHAIHASVPYYNKYKFSSNNPLLRSNGSPRDNTSRDSVTYSTFISPAVANSSYRQQVSLYCSAGTDFSPVFFLNVPGYILYPDVPASQDI